MLEEAQRELRPREPEIPVQLIVLSELRQICEFEI